MNLKADVLLFIIILVVVFIVCALFNDSSEKISNDRFIQELSAGLQSPPNVLLVIAHPDDESVFFAPTLIALRDHNIPISILCMSTGEGRTQELIDLSSSIGISEEHVRVKSFEDRKGLYWNANEVAAEISDASFHWGCNVIISFDEKGASGHTNHISCYRGLKLYQGDAKRYKLKTRPISAELEARVGTWRFALNMLSKHKSQDTWWRRIGIIMSRHSRSNSYSEIK